MLGRVIQGQVSLGYLGNAAGKPTRGPRAFFSGFLHPLFMAPVTRFKIEIYF